MTKFHLDGSEVSWLVYADWLEDQDRDASFIREMVANCPCHPYKLEALPMNDQVGNGYVDIFVRVGCLNNDYNAVGSNCTGQIYLNNRANSVGFFPLTGTRPFGD